MLWQLLETMVQGNLHLHAVYVAWKVKIEVKLNIMIKY